MSGAGAQRCRLLVHTAGSQEGDAQMTDTLLSISSGATDRIVEAESESMPLKSLTSYGSIGQRGHISLVPRYLSNEEI